MRGGEQTVSTVVEKVLIQQSGVSRHLSILQENGFVTMRPEGQKRFYSIRPERFQEIDEWVQKYRVLWEARLDRFAAALDKKQKSKRPTRKEPAK